MGMKPQLSDQTAAADVKGAGTQRKYMDYDTPIKNAGTTKKGGCMSPQSQIKGSDTPPPKGAGGKKGSY